MNLNRPNPRPNRSGSGSGGFASAMLWAMRRLCGVVAVGVLVQLDHGQVNQGSGIAMLGGCLVCYGFLRMLKRLL